MDVQRRWTQRGRCLPQATMWIDALKLWLTLGTQMAWSNGLLEPVRCLYAYQDASQHICTVIGCSTDAPGLQ